MCLLPENIHVLHYDFIGILMVFKASHKIFVPNVHNVISVSYGFKSVQLLNGCKNHLFYFNFIPSVAFNIVYLSLCNILCLLLKLQFPG